MIFIYAANYTNQFETRPHIALFFHRVPTLFIRMVCITKYQYKDDMLDLCICMSLAGLVFTVVID